MSLRINKLKGNNILSPRKSELIFLWIIFFLSFALSFFYWARRPLYLLGAEFWIPAYTIVLMIITYTFIIKRSHSINFKIWKNPLFLPISFIILGFLLSSFTAESPLINLFYLFKFFSVVLLCFLLTETIKEEKVFYKILWVFVAIMSVLTTLGFYNFFTTEGAHNFNFDYFSTQTKTDAGIYLLLAIFCGLGLMATLKKNSLKRYLLVCMMILMGIATILTYSRLVWFGLIFSLLYFFTTNWKKLILVTIVLLLVLVPVFVFNQRLSNRFLSTFVITKDISSPLYSSNYLRITLLEDALKIISEHPFLGVGAGENYLFQVSKLRNIFPWTLYAHDVFLQIWADLGIFGLLGFISIIIVAISSLLKTRKFIPFNSALRHINRALSAVMITYTILFFVTASYLHVALWLLLGFVMISSRLAMQKHNIIPYNQNE